MPLHFVRHKSRQIIRFWRQKGYARLLPLLSAIRVGGLLAAALALWGFALIADEVLENQTQKIDSAILLALLSLHTPLLDRVMRAIRFVGEPSFLLVICLIVASVVAVEQTQIRSNYTGDRMYRCYRLKLFAQKLVCPYQTNVVAT